MKVKGAKQVHYEAGPNMVPLVDVVMVILIFLMLTGSFGMTSHFFHSQAPVERTGKGPADTKVDKPPDPKILVTVVADGQTYATVNNIKQPTVEKLAEFLANERVRYARTDAEGNKVPGDDRDPPLQIQLQPAGAHDYKAVLDAYQVIVAAKFPKIGFKMVAETSAVKAP